MLDVESFVHSLHQPRVQASLAVLAVGLTLVLRSQSSRLSQEQKVIPSPRLTLLPRLSDAETADLPYPPDVLPGARDVSSPYGSLRVYEWGPEEGRKVLLIHGISTPCISLGGVAHGLVEKGCRVMLLDLWGRGYSDTPCSLPHDTRLFATAVLLALTSSSLSWTGTSTFSLVGYSLGGGIAVSFTSYFPRLVKSLVLLAPSGLVRPKNISATSWLLYSTGFAPESLLIWMVRSRLSSSSSATPKSAAAEHDPVGELPKLDEGRGVDQTILSRSRPGVTATAAAVAWQVNYHKGFVKSFMSSVRYGPISNQHDDWRKVGKKLAAQNVNSDEKYAAAGLQNGKVLIISGEKDLVIIKNELMEDATEVLGANNVRFQICDVGHELPITKSKEVVKHIWGFWETS